MVDSPDNHADDCKLDVVPSRKLGAFEFMADHLFDLVIIVIRTADDGSDVIRRIELYYSENHNVSCFAFDRSSKQYNADTHKALHAALNQLIKEVKSRSLSHQNFVVWYFTEADRVLMEKHAKSFIEENRGLSRYYKILQEKARIIPESADQPPQ